MESTVRDHHPLPLPPSVRPCVQGFVECSFVSRMYPLPPMALHLLKQLFPQVQCRRCCRSLVTKSCVTFATPWTAACQASLSFTISQSLPKLKSIESWCHPTISYSVTLFSCPQSFPASGSFPIVSSLHHAVKLLQLQLQHQSYQWIFSGLISFRIDWVDLLAVHEILKSLPQHYSLKMCSSVLSLLYVQLSHPYIPTRKTIALTIRTFLAQQFLIQSLGLSQFFLQGEGSFNFMAAVPVLSNLGAQEKKICHCLHVFPDIFFFFFLPEMLGPEFRSFNF